MLLFTLRQHQSISVHCSLVSHSMTKSQCTPSHTLDLVSSEGLYISSVMNTSLALSDYPCVFFDLLITPEVQISTVSVQRRHIDKSTSAQFMEAIAMLVQECRDS